MTFYRLQPFVASSSNPHSLADGGRTHISMLNSKNHSSLVLLIVFNVLFGNQGQCLGQSSQETRKGHESYVALPLSGKIGEVTPIAVYRYGVPFAEGALPPATGDSSRVDVGTRAKRIFFLGMYDSDKLPSRSQLKDTSFRSLSSIIRPATPARGWNDPRNDSVRFFVGDKLGQIRIDYSDGSSETFPLILGEGVWWGRAFYDYPDPFPTDVKLRNALATALRLFPPRPLRDGNYVGVIVPKRAAIRNILVENSPAKKGTLVIVGITVETSQGDSVSAATDLMPGAFSPAFRKFIQTKALRRTGQDERQSRRRLNILSHALYSSDQDYKRHVANSVPSGYSGPEVSFRGTIFAEILANVFRYNVQDIADKIDKDGMYHTSTKDALSWGGYNGVGTFRKNLGRYYDATFSRDMGRSLQELTALGYVNEATRCADYCLRMAHVYSTDPALRYKGVVLPPHWGQLINKPGGQPFENDGQGLTILFLYRLWQQLPNREEWLRAHWPDIKAAGDWILWQFTHPEISGAKDGMLHTTGEAAHGSGNSVFADCICMHALQALSQMAVSLGDSLSARSWLDRAHKMRQAITQDYIVDDPKYGKVWTLAYADWPDKSGVLGPLIFQADYQGFASADSYPEWRVVNEHTYKRLIDTYKPFGFYGQAMGYGQGFVTESALLLDRMRDATDMLNWIAKQVYDPKFGSYIVPEGCEIDPTGRFWYRIGDLGNGVQEGEIIKTLRIMIGVDDTQADRLQFFPRMPYGWTEMGVEKYPVVFMHTGEMGKAYLWYELVRSGDKMNLRISATKELGPVAMRLGPFAMKPEASSIRVNGKAPNRATVEHNGDSWWIRFNFTVGPLH